MPPEAPKLGDLATHEAAIEAKRRRDVAALDLRRRHDLASLGKAISAQRLAGVARLEQKCRVDIAALEAVQRLDVASMDAGFEAPRRAEVATLEARRVADLAAFEAEIEAKRVAEVAALEAKRLADLAALEAARLADLATLGAKRKLDLETLEAFIQAKRRAEVATLEAKRLADLAALEASFEATRLAEVANLELDCLAELANLEAKRIADVAGLEAARLADVAAHEASVEMARFAEVQALETRRGADLAMLEQLIEATCRAESATLETKRKADVAQLEAVRLADVAVLEATLAAQRRADLAALETRRLADLELMEESIEMERRSSMANLEANCVADHVHLVSRRMANIAALEAMRQADQAALDLRNTQPGPPSSRMPAWAAKSVRIMPALSEAARKSSKASPKLTSRWRVPIAMGLFLASWLCIASVIGILQGAKDGRDARKSHQAECRAARDVITDWGKRLAVEASTLGQMMVRERYLAAAPRVPFLVPGSLSRALQLDRLELMAEEFDQLPPTVVWYPTVKLEDREAYEAYAGNFFGLARPINITDEGTGPSQFTSFIKVRAPTRPDYNPLTDVWTVGDPAGGAAVVALVGVDAQERYRRTLPLKLQKRFLEERKLVAHPLYLAAGGYLRNFAFVVRVPLFDEDCEFDDPDCFVDGKAPPLGYVSFSLEASRWVSIFPANMRVCISTTGHVVKTVPSNDLARHASAHEPFLDLDLKCYHRHQDNSAMHYVVGVIISPFVIALLLFSLWRVEVRISRDRRDIDERRRDAARDAAAAAIVQRKDERIQYGFEMSEKTEQYLNHELKNRIFVLGQSCVDEAMVSQIDEITEVLSSKAVLMRLTRGRYKPSWDSVEPTALVDRRWQRHATANSPFQRAPTTGAAAYRTALRLDKHLINIILDNMLSNAFKYGDAARPPSLALNVEPLDDASARVRFSLEVRNWAGPEHTSLLQMGTDKLNEIAHAEGCRAHEHTAEMSAGDGFPMAAAAATALGGTLRLVLLLDGVVAKLELPDVAAVLPVAPKDEAAVVAAPVELSWLKIAMADDSASFRKTFARLAEKVTSRKPIVAGESRESIDAFPKLVVEGDVDVILLDFNFAPVHHTKTGVDLCRECRQLDAEEGNVPRLIFIVSANDSPDDAERYRAAGADGSLGKKLTAAKLRQVLEDAVLAHPRFAAHRDAAAVVAEVPALETPPADVAAAAAVRCLAAVVTPMMVVSPPDSPLFPCSSPQHSMAAANDLPKPDRL
ncbi:hypothetical protein M885DRAFT_521764 [Pelagophyceae sp. CCMP2097]|nr:hypothetical protein M885DRAFT_521764 [Pelagophyceae sp. CCMP2097]